MGSDTTVLVAGGGIGGLAGATALALAGFPALVVEKVTRTDRGGGGLVLYPNGLKALGAISPRLRDAVLAAGHQARPGDVRPVLNPAGEVVAVDQVGELATRFGVPQVSLLRADLHAILLAEAARAGVTMLAGPALVDHADRGHEVSCALSDGSPVTAAILIGADGLHSGVRQRLLGDGPPRYRGYTTLRGVAGEVGAYPNGFIATGDGVALFAAPIRGGKLYWTAKLAAKRGTWPAMRRGQALTRLLGVLDGWHPPIVRVIEDVEDRASVVVTDIHDREPVQRWSAGRVTLLGDAAHPMSPGTGQGASMALEDATVLAAALRAGTPVPDALRSYARRRMPRTSLVTQLSRQADRVVAGDGPEFSTQDGQIAELFGWQPDCIPLPASR